MRVRTLAPLHLSDGELARRQQRYQALAPAPLEMVMANLPADPEVPRSLASEAACRASDHFVLVAGLTTAAATFDALLLDCVLDPALEALRERAPVPAFGILNLAAGQLAALGHRLAAVTRNRAIAEELERRIDAFGLRPVFVGTVVLDLSFAAIADDAVWNSSLAQALDQAECWGASALINGCSAVTVHRHDSPVLVVDPTALALELLAHAAARGLLPPSRAGVGRR